MKFDRVNLVLSEGAADRLLASGNPAITRAAQLAAQIFGGAMSINPDRGESGCHKCNTSVHQSFLSDITP